MFITGGAGYIGSHIISYLIRKNYQITVFDLVPPHGAVLNKLKYIYGDVRKYSTVKSAIQHHTPDVLIHLAAKAGFAMNDRDKKIMKETNIDGTRNVLDAVLQTEVKYILFTSSAAVYGSSDVRVDENAPIQPSGLYGKTKLIGEQLVRLASETKRINYAILRLFNVVGNCSGVHLTSRANNRQSLMTNIVNAFSSNYPHIEIYGSDYLTRDGTAIRDYIHVEDVSRALFKALQHIMTLNNSILTNIGTGKGYTNKEVVRLMEKIARRKLRIQFKKRRQGETACSIADNTQARRAFHLELRHSTIRSIIKSVYSYNGIRV